MLENGSSRSGFLPSRTIHLHASRFCNLACQHCYSMSGPNEHGELAPQEIISALTVFKAEGYDVLSLSGGEPLLYSGFEEVVHSAIALGFRLNLITNGAPVGGRLLNIIAEYVHLIAISLDGAPHTHTEIRGDPRAFIRAERAMDRLFAMGVPYGISYCVSRQSLTDMPWAVEFAAAKGAALVQFHPFAATGRGRRLVDRLGLDAADKARAYVLATLLETREGPRIQIDLAPIEAVLAQRSDYAVLGFTDARDMLLSDLINPLVIDEKGRVLPLSYGIDPQLKLGRIDSNLPTLIAHYKAEGWHDIRALLDAAFTRLDTNDEHFIDWFHHVVETSYTLCWSANTAAHSH
jgi:Fe-coproporphyrin III synthase